MKLQIIIAGAAILIVGTFLVATKLYKEQQHEAMQKTVEKVSTKTNSPVKRPDAPMIGTIMAKVEIVEFFDPACEGCRAFHPYVKSVLENNKHRVRLSLRYATFHAGSDYVAQMLEAARIQGQDLYIKVLEKTLETQPVWANHANPRPELIWDLVADTGLDIQRAKKEMNDPSIIARLKRDASDIAELGIRRTPTFFVNGKLLRELSPASLAQQVAEEVSASYR